MSEEPTFTISEVAMMVGLSAHTIRIWERRYEVTRPQRSSAGHRRYGLDDVQMLQRMKHLAEARGITLKMAALEVQGGLPAPSAPAETSRTGEGTGMLKDDSPWRAAADLLPQPILLLETSGRIADANVAFARAGGFIREKLRGTRFSELIDPHDRAKASAIWRDAGQPKRGWELNLRTPTGSGLYSFDCWPLLSRGHQLLVLIGRELSRSGMELWPLQRDAGDEA
ncbi:MerR family transcriptional regulator [Candidatus Nephthysia bennettiae]|uniref:MerR family transcriptional regulator n=1 Tax=Candidatus Nephthysia bennettiae TaxID=3127016 RepID=A0A934N3L5_9BACT|nr:MerR family transcriptional regulator [Candidatus Dormibacteraeota bacterium]MBJ7611879.1 MerR family transcriptional regulator [Candidatus Dormibacteraeota bacterium]